MSLKQIVKYVLNTNWKQISLDREQYESLRVKRISYERAYLAAEREIVGVRAPECEDAGARKACRIVYLPIVTEFNQGNDTISSYYCEHFDATHPCQQVDCPMFQKNEKLFKCHESYKKCIAECRQFWADKFARIN